MLSIESPTQKLHAKNPYPRINKRLVIFLISTIIMGSFMPFLYADEKTTIGAVEDVIVLPWNLRLPARIDTGAATTSIDARNIKIKDGNMVEFCLPKKYGGIRILLPVVELKTVKSAVGDNRRPVVEMEMCIGSVRFREQVNLNDRSKMEYPLLIGRNVLKNNFIVDVSRNNLLDPVCLEAVSK